MIKQVSESLELVFLLPDSEALLRIENLSNVLFEMHGV